MLTEIIFLLLKNNYNLFTIFNFLRDFFILLIFIFSLGSIVTNFFYSKKLNRLYLFELIITIILSFVIVNLLKNNISSIRPLSFFLASADQKFDSFPSLHTTFGFSIAFITLISNLQLGLLLLVLSIWVALLSWLSLSHWPIDIIAGLIISLIITYFTFWITQSFLRFYTKKRKIQI